MQSVRAFITARKWKRRGVCFKESVWIFSGPDGFFFAAKTCSGCEVFKDENLLVSCISFLAVE